MVACGRVLYSKEQIRIEEQSHPTEKKPHKRKKRTSKREQNVSIENKRHHALTSSDG